MKQRRAMRSGRFGSAVTWPTRVIYAGLSLAVSLTLVAACEPKTAASGTNCPSFPPAEAEPIGGPVAATNLGEASPQPSPSRHVPFPSGPIETVHVKLERSGCYGSCPSYSVEISGTGHVLFKGDSFVTFAGEHRRRVPANDVACLVDNFRAADFWSLASKYEAPITDSPTYRITFSINGQSKTVTDYVGRAVGMPESVTDLETAIDQTAHTATWIRGDSRTIPALEEEGFDFASPRAARYLASAVAEAPDPVVFGLLRKHVPVDGRVARDFSDRAGPTAVEVAALYGRLEILRALIAAGVFDRGGRKLVSATLRASVGSQRLDVVREVLKYHPDVNGRDEYGETALMLIFTGAHPHAGDENWPDETVGIIKLLGQAGANPNIANKEGETPLSNAYDEDQIAALKAICAKQASHS